MHNESSEAVRALNRTVADALPAPWALRHCQAWGHRHPWNLPPNESFERALVAMIQAAALYADAHAERYGDAIGNDGVLGAHLAEVLSGIRGLLNGEAGRLDCGTLDAMVLAIVRTAGLNEEMGGVL